MNKSILVLVMASAFSLQANAFQVQADHYTITYDDAFWGGPEAGVWKKNTLTFSNLELVTSAKGLRNTEDASSAYWSSDWDLDSALITITADSGYKIAAISSGAKGYTSTVTGDSPGAFAEARVAVGGAWSSIDPQVKDPWFGSDFSNDGTSLGKVLFKGAATTSFASGTVDSGPAALAFGLETTTASAGPMIVGVQSATLTHFYADLYANAKGVGSHSKAALNAVAFSVDVVPVPEPETYAMMLAGLGLMGTIARRRSKSKTS